MEPLTLTFVTVMFVVGLYLVLVVRNDLRAGQRMEHRQPPPAARGRRR